MSDQRSTVTRIMALFKGHDGMYGTHGEPTQQLGKQKWEIKSTARTWREPVTEALWAKHLAGTQPLGISPIRTDNTCLWGSIDVDQYNVEFSELLRKIREQDMALVPCRSKSGGLHLFLFTSEPVPAGVMQTVLTNVAARLGLSGSEIFPKQTAVREDRGDLGSWMVMPYYGDTYGGKIQRQVGVDENNVEQTIEEFLDTAEPKRVSAQGLRDMIVVDEAPSGNGARRTSSNGRRSSTAGSAASSGDFRDGPPCLQNLAQEGFPEGGRNNALFHVGVYLKRARPSTWKEDLAEHNRRYFVPPVGSEELAMLTKSLAKKDYDYKCKDEPMKAFCNSGLCRTRRFGVGGLDVPKVTSLRVMDSEPCIWFVTLEGGNTVEIGTPELMEYKKFRTACVEKLKIMYGMMKEDAWGMILQDAWPDLTIIQDETKELSTLSRFRELLEDFLTNRQRGERREDLLSGRPYEDEQDDCYYFRLADLVKFLKRQDARQEDGRHFARGRVVHMIRTEFKGDSKSIHVGNTSVGTWYVPRSAIRPTPPPPPPPPEPTSII